MREQVCCSNEAANHQLPIAVAFWIIRIVSMEECSSVSQNLMQIHCSTCSIILNAMATQYSCSPNGIYCPHWIVQWSHHCSHTHVPVHSPWLPGYIDVTQTVLFILTMVGLFPYRPRIPWYIWGLSRKSPAIVNVRTSVCRDINVTWQPRGLNWDSHARTMMTSLC